MVWRGRGSIYDRLHHVHKCPTYPAGFVVSFGSLRCFVSRCDGVSGEGITAGEGAEWPSVISQNNGAYLRGTIILA